MTAAAELTAALASADEAAERAERAALAAHEQQVGTAKLTLADALAAHDAVVADADAKSASAVEAASVARAAARAAAEAAFDAAMQAELGAPDARIEVSPGGAAFLRVGRTTHGSMVQVGGGHWRISGSTGIAFVADPASARERLWKLIDAS